MTSLWRVAAEGKFACPGLGAFRRGGTNPGHLNRSQKVITVHSRVVQRDLGKEGPVISSHWMNEWWCHFKDPRFYTRVHLAEDTKTRREGGECCSFPILSTQQTQTHSRGHLYTNATVSGSLVMAGHWQAGRWVKLRETPLCLHLTIIQIFPLITPMTTPQDVQGTLSQKNHIWLSTNSRPSHWPLCWGHLSSVLCMWARNDPKSKQPSSSPRSQKAILLHGWLLVSIPAPHGIRCPARPWLKWVTTLASKGGGVCTWSILRDPKVWPVWLGDWGKRMPRKGNTACQDHTSTLLSPN